MTDLQEKSIELWREEAWMLHAKLRKAEYALREIAFGYVDWKAPDISLEVAMDIARHALKEGKDD